MLSADEGELDQGGPPMGDGKDQAAERQTATTITKRMVDE